MIFTRMSLHCKLVPVQYREYEYGVFVHNKVFNLHFQRARLMVKLASLYISMHMGYCTLKPNFCYGWQKICMKLK